jgi:L-glyceraldehyde 3-phosphate reductase
MLTDKYLRGIPEGSRATQGKSLDPRMINDEARRHLLALDEIAAARGQSLAQLALAWALRDRRVTSVLVGASSPEQIRANVGAVANLGFTDDELAAIEEHAVDGGIDLWRAARESAG